MSVLHTDIQTSMVANLLLEMGGLKAGGYRYWWHDGKVTRWSLKFKTRDQAVKNITRQGFGAYRFGGKKIKLI